jgi:hypothetical protein
MNKETSDDQNENATIDNQNEMKKEFPSIMGKYGGFLPMSPSNTAIDVLVRVYIIEATITDPIYVSGECYPYICIKVGERTYSDSKVINDTADKKYLIARQALVSSSF